MENRGTLVLVLIVLALVFFSSDITGNASLKFPTYTGVNYNTYERSLYAIGNVNKDPNGNIDYFDLVKLKNLIILREYDLTGDIDQDNDVDWEDYSLLEDIIGSGGGSGYIIPRSDVCSLGETRCTTNGQSGTGAIIVCKENEYGVPTFYREDCSKGERCRNGFCEYKELTPETFTRIGL